SEQIDAYTKGEDDALLFLKANQSTIYIKTEIDYQISKIEVCDVDLSGCMTLDTTQAITTNKSFNDACRFISSLDGMSSITWSSFVKSGADDTVVLLGAGGTKSISEFSSSVDDSNYVKKYDNVQDIQRILRKTTIDQQYLEPTDDDYITLGAVKSEFVSSIYSGSIRGNITATSSLKSDKDDTLYKQFIGEISINTQILNQFIEQSLMLASTFVLQVISNGQKFALSGKTPDGSF
ncbi:MAG: hypothetical protein EZS28_042792, partial [Streblomastix strix]